MLETKSDHTSSAVAQPVSPSQYIHATAQKSTGAAPIWAIARYEHHGREQARERDADHGKAHATHHTLNERRHHDAECDAAYRLSGEVHDLFAARPRKTPEEQTHTRRRALSIRVHNGCKDECQDELQRHHSEPADLTREPAGDAARGTARPWL